MTWTVSFGVMWCIKLEDGQVKLQSRLEQEEDAKAALLGRIQRLTKLILVSSKASQSSRFTHRPSLRRRHSFGEEEVWLSCTKFFSSLQCFCFGRKTLITLVHHIIWHYARWLDPIAFLKMKKEKEKNKFYLSWSWLFINHTASIPTTQKAGLDFRRWKHWFVCFSRGECRNHWWYN